MIEIRRSDERGRNRLEWLETRHTFSFDRYYDPRHMGFGHLRVINEDWFAPGGGFPMHRHRDMEIVTYMLEGVLEHRDSMGNTSVVRAGEVQRMTAGTGILHSEFNPSDAETAHLLQIWIHPREKGLRPSYEQKAMSHGPAGGIRLIASPDGRDGSVIVQQDLFLHAGRLSAGDSFRHELPAGAKAWLQVARGAVSVNGTALETGDGAAIQAEQRLDIRATSVAEILLFDMR